MQTHDMAEKVKILVDGEELPGLVNFGELVVEKATIEVPEFHKIRNIQSGISKIPMIDATYKLGRTTKTLKFLRDWYYNDESHDITKVRCDAHGVEFARTLLPSCECVKYFEPAFDGASPTYAQVQTKFVPWDVVPVE